MPNTGNEEQRDLIRQDAGDESNLPSEMRISLGKNKDLDLSGLTPEQIQQLKMRHAEGAIDLTKAAHQKATDVQALDAGLRSMVENTAQAAEAGQSVTVTHTQENDFGRTEVLIGSSDAARRGKLTRSQTGGKDYTLVWAGLAAFVIIIVALIAVLG